MLHSLKIGPTAMTPTVPSPPPPILLPLSEPPATSAPTPVTLPPPEALSSSQSVVSRPPVPKKSHKMGDWLKAVITGSIIGSFILLGIVLSNIFPSIINSIFPKKPKENIDISTTNINPEQTTTPSPKSITSVQPQIPKTALTPIVSSISEIEAKKLIET
ncbi:MAG: hypothetical protein F6K24_21905 [Okeania sp. SIO2D1]|uniref:hypothetical protein n=1 Tax=Okeania sp. SIO2C9 TaxID=2607791 RepID=UPI0013B7FA87|nr:hypothetical protein [Okeania sp. SIO2C9]NEQ77330.1 hypothetical protein [Okeania sp. SIO2C9]NES67704.1 hypothetical protein [Okeania sp. SIO2D1]